MDDSRIDPLFAQVAAGHERAFAELYNRFVKRLYRTAVGMLGSREDAEDVVQEVFLSVFKSRKNLDPSRDITPYLFTALRHAAGRKAMSRARAPRLFETPIDNVSTPQQRQHNANAHHERLQRALLALPVEQREIITMKIDGELTFAQIAHVLDISINTAASRYRYALEKLRVSLNPKDGP